MSDQHEAEPAAAPYSATTTEDTGAPASGEPGGRQPLTGRLIIQTFSEGNTVVITILAIFVALLVGAILIVASDPVVLRAWDSFSYAPGTALSATEKSATMPSSDRSSGT